MGIDFGQLLIDAVQKREAEAAGEAEDDDRFEEDSPEAADLRKMLESQYDHYLEEAAMRGFGVSLAHPCGKRYLLFKKRSKDEAEKYDRADDAKKRQMIEAWIKGEYEKYQDTR